MRKPWDQYFLDICDMVATRSTCPRLAVGAVLVWQHQIIATGYNGAGPGLPHCTDVGCRIEPCTLHDQHCVRARHAESNIIDQLITIDAGFTPAEYREMTLFVTHEPCLACRNDLEEWDIIRFQWRHPYRSDYGTGRCSMVA